MNDITLLVAFGAGIASFLSPCVLPLVPVFLGSLAGPEVFEAEYKIKRMSVFLHSLSFFIGFSIIFGLWGAGAGLLGSAFIAYSVLIRKISGGLLIFMGLFMLASLIIPWLNYEKRLNMPMGRTNGYLRSMVTGAIFCFAWSPCLGGPIVSILGLAGGLGTVWKGTYLLVIYSLGLGLPFLAFGIAFDVALPFFKRVYRYSNIIYVVSSILLIAVGILILTNKLILFHW